MLTKISLLLLSLTFISNIDRYVCQLKYSNNTYPYQNPNPNPKPNPSPNPNPYPIVLLHGISSDKSELSGVANWLMEKLPNKVNKVNKVKVYNIEIGNGKMDSIFKTMDWQLNELCYQIYSIPELENGFHFIGMSQGGLLARGYVEQCNKFPVQNLITWVSPHAGVYGIGNISGLDINFKHIYTSIYQNIYSFSGYWKDPFRYEQYLSSASYLPYLNNEPTDNNFQKMQNSYYLLDNFYQSIEWDPEKSKNNMLSLKNFVMIWSANDDVLSPPESGKFGFYKIVSKQSIQSIQPNELLPIIDLFESEQYTKDLIGLQTLYKSNRLHMLETNCTHSGHKTQECFPQLEILTFPFLV